MPKRFIMTLLQRKISQIQEYNTMYQEYKKKYLETLGLMWDKITAWGKIYSEQQSVERFVIHKIHPDCFGDYTHPCVVKRLGWDDEARRLWNGLRLLSGREDEEYTFPDMVNRCPKFKKETACEKSDCMHYNANQEYFITKAKFEQALEENKKFNSLDNLRIQAFGKVLACLIKKIERKKESRAELRAFKARFVHVK